MDSSASNYTDPMRKEQAKVTDWLRSIPAIAAPEPWVDAETVGEHIGFKADHVRVLARTGRLPGTPMKNGKRTYWRFKLSLVDAAMSEAA